MLEREEGRADGLAGKSRRVSSVFLKKKARYQQNCEQRLWERAPKVEGAAESCQGGVNGIRV